LKRRAQADHGSTTGSTELAGTDSYSGSVPMNPSSSQFVRLAIQSLINQ
jgi:hypothetical protein